MKIKIYFNWNTEMAWIYWNRTPQHFNDEPDEKIPIIEALKKYVNVPDSMEIEEKEQNNGNKGTED